MLLHIAFPHLSFPGNPARPLKIQVMNKNKKIVRTDNSTNNKDNNRSSTDSSREISSNRNCKSSSNPNNPNSNRRNCLTTACSCSLSLENPIPN